MAGRASDIPEWAFEEFARLLSTRDLDTGCVELVGLRPGGYKGRTLYVRLRKQIFNVRRLVLTAKEGQLPPAAVVIPTCQNSCCIAEEHLKLISRGTLQREALRSRRV
jgi:hypothetical protein